MEITAVRPVRSYEAVVHQIGNQIASGALVCGQKLPGEREMSARFGVSRVVIREAIRVMSTLGLVQVRHGSGVYVCNNLAPAISRILNLTIAPQGQHAPAIDRLFDLRAAIEAQAASSAAERHDASHLAEINESIAAMVTALELGDLDASLEADWRFHVAVSAAADNPYIDLTLRAIRDTLDEVSRLITSQRDGPADAVAEHHRIASAIAAGDAVAASTEMRNHIRSACARHLAMIEMGTKAITTNND